MDTITIRYFLELAQELHYWRAAANLHITQSSLSRHIQQLEAETGIQLFNRNKRRVQLTPAGAFLQEEWQRLLTQLEHTQRHARQLAEGWTGTVHMAYVGSVAHWLLPDLLTRLAKNHPALRLQLSELPAAEVEQALLRYRIDFALKRQAPQAEALGAALLQTEHFALVVPAAHKLKRAGFTNLQQLADEPFILPLHRQYLDPVFNYYGYTPEAKWMTDFGTTMLGLVAKGLGISIVPESYKQGAPAGLRFIRLPVPVSLYAVWRKDDQNPALAHLFRLLKACLQ